MFKLKTSLTLLAVATLGIFHLLYVYHAVPYVAVNLLFLFLAPIGYLFSAAGAASLVCISWAVLFPLFTRGYGIDGLNAAVPLAVFSALVFVSAAYRYVINREEGLWERRMAERTEARRRLAEEYEKAGRFEAGIKAKELSIINLYEITKKMSEGLKFSDIFATFSTFLKENFVFRKCSLLVLRREDEAVSIDREYDVWQDASAASTAAGSSSARAEKTDLDKLARMFIDGSKDIYISRSQNPHIFRDLGIASPEVETLVTIPLLSEKKIVGILAVENLPKPDVERLIIVSMQFALEIRKVLLYEMVERLAITDSLTGLFVRRHFFERFDEELRRSKRHRFAFALLMIDIDNFKKCNDTYGHLVGDFILKEIARVIKENVREIDIVARYGGEEVAIILPETGEENARLVAERLRRKVEEQLFRAYDEKVRTTVSIGFAVYPRDAGEAAALVEKADRALYAAKKTGKNVVCEYER